MAVGKSISALTDIPPGLRDPLIEEYGKIVNNFMEHRWSTAELSGGRFCEIVYTILEGFPSKNYAISPTKPTNFVDACRRLESNVGIPRSFQILIPRMLLPLYEIRNNRNVGHVGGDVNPDFMDSSAVVAMCSWILSELVRVFHGLTTEEAQSVVDGLSERRIPVVWKSDEVRRVLLPKLPLKDQLLLLISSISGKVAVEDLFKWSDYSNRSHFNRILRSLHSSRFVELDEDKGMVEMLPPGSAYVSDLLMKLSD